MPRPFWIAILASLLGVLGCKGVQSGDLAGTWVMKDDSRRVLPHDLQQASGKIALDENGSFVIFLIAQGSQNSSSSGYSVGNPINVCFFIICLRIDMPICPNL